MAFVMSPSGPVALDFRVYSWSDQVAEAYGSATSYNHYLDLSADQLTDPATIWRTQRSVRTVVGFLARNIAQVSLHAFARKPDGDRDRVPAAHPLSRTLRSPSPTLGSYELIESIVIDMCIYNRFAAVKALSDDGERMELVRMPPELFQFKRDKLKRPLSLVTIDGKTEIQLEDLLWIDGYPGDEVPIASLVGLLTEEYQSSKYRRDLWDGGARIPGWIERPIEAPEWSRLARDKFRSGWRAYASGGASVGKTPILEDGMKYHSANTVTPEQGQQIEARKLAVSEVAAAYFVPPVFVGVLDNANYSNVTAYREILYSDTLGPWFAKLGQAFQSRLVPDFDDPDLFVEFNVGEKLRMSFDDQARIFQTATGGPFMTRNEARRRLNLPQVEGADELIVPLNVIEGGQASPTDADSTT